MNTPQGTFYALFPEWFYCKSAILLTYNIATITPITIAKQTAVDKQCMLQSKEASENCL